MKEVYDVVGLHLFKFNWSCSGREL